VKAGKTMAFENLAERLQNAIKMFRSTSKITEEDLKAPLREVRMALLEADVNFKVVKDFIGRVKERALGTAVEEKLSASQQIIKIVDEELTRLLGGTQAKLVLLQINRLQSLCWLVCRAQAKLLLLASWPCF
jgi:signal recognition particle subunit SRP54